MAVELESSADVSQEEVVDRLRRAADAIEYGGIIHSYARAKAVDTEGLVERDIHVAYTEPYKENGDHR